MIDKKEMTVRTFLQVLFAHMRPKDLDSSFKIRIQDPDTEEYFIFPVVAVQATAQQNLNDDLGDIESKTDSVQVVAEVSEFENRHELFDDGEYPDQEDIGYVENTMWFGWKDAKQGVKA